MRKYPYLIIIVFLYSIILYHNTLHVPFYLDDYSGIAENTGIRDIQSFIFPEGKRNPTQQGTRFIGFLSFAINYHLNGLEVEGYHIVNIIVHALAGVLVYLLTFMLTDTPVVKFSEQDRRNVAFLTALLFLSHPVQTQAVTYIIQRLASMAGMFYLASIVFYLRFRRAVSKGPVWYLLSIFMALLATFTKEITFTLPFMILLIEFIFYGRQEKQKFLRMSPYFVIALLIPLTLISSRSNVQSYDTVFRAETDIDRLTYLLTETRVLLTYFRILLYPAGQRLFYDFPLYHSITDPQVMLALGVNLSLIGIG
ncbi:MAG: hypothetical protein D6726_10795, partial [Nitrospirae bacterium]